MDTSKDEYKYNSKPEHDDGWIILIENKSIEQNKLNNYNIKYTRNGEYSVYTFSAEKYPLTQQVWLAPYTVIKASNPTKLDNARERQDITKQTIFYSDWSKIASISGGEKYAKTKITVPDLFKDSKYLNHIQKLKGNRIGFLMNNNTVLQNFIGNGYLGNFSNSVGDMGLNGGGFIELPGCATSYRDTSGNNKCGGPQENYYYASHNDLGKLYSDWKEWWYTGDGKGITNVLVENIRINDMQHQLDCSNYPSTCNNKENAIWPLQQLYTNTLFWSGLAINDISHKNIYLRQIFSGITHADGINVHGKVNNFKADNIHIENTHDDSLAIWGVNSSSPGNAGSIPCDDTEYCITHGHCAGLNLNTCFCPKTMGNQLGSNINFNNITLRIDSDNQWGRCIGIFGAQDASINNISCYDTRNNEIVNKFRTYCGAGSSKLNLEFKNIQYYDNSQDKLCKLNKFDECNTFINKVIGTRKGALHGNTGSAKGVNIISTNDGFNIKLNFISAIAE